MAKIAQPRSIPTGPWGPETADAIQQNFERIYGSSGRLGAGGGSTLVNGLDTLVGAAGSLIVGTAAGLFVLVPIVGTAQRSLTNNGGTPTWALVDLTNGVTGALPLANLAAASVTQRLLGRNSVGSGVYEEVTLSQLLDWIGVVAQGDILYRGAAGWARLAAGTAGYLLSTGGAAANPSWVAPASSVPGNSLYDVGHYLAVLARGDATSYNVLGLNSATANGNAPTAQINDGVYLRHTTTASVSGSSSNFTTVAHIDWSLPVDIIFVVKTVASLAKVRMWAGFATSAPFAADTASTRFVGFRYTSTAGNWKGVNFDNTTQAVTADVATIATATKYKLRIRTDGTQAWFSVNGSAEVNLSSNFPGGATRVGLTAGIVNVDNTAGATSLDILRAYGYVGA